MFPTWIQRMWCDGPSSGAVFKDRLGWNLNFLFSLPPCLLPSLRIEPTPLAVEVWSSNLWTTMEVLALPVPYCAHTPPAEVSPSWPSIHLCWIPARVLGCVCEICLQPECTQFLAVTVTHGSLVSSQSSRVCGEPRAHCWSLPRLRGPRYNSGQRIPIGIAFPSGPCSAPLQTSLGFHSFWESETTSLQVICFPVTTAWVGGLLG